MPQLAVGRPLHEADLHHQLGPDPVRVQARQRWVLARAAGRGPGDGARQAAEAGDFEYVVTNDDVDRAVDEIEAIMARALGEPTRSGLPRKAGSSSCSTAA